AGRTSRDWCPRRATRGWARRAEGEKRSSLLSTSRPPPGVPAQGTRPRTSIPSAGTNRIRFNGSISAAGPITTPRPDDCACSIAASASRRHRPLRVRRKHPSTNGASGDLDREEAPLAHLDLVDAAAEL